MSHPTAPFDLIALDLDGTTVRQDMTVSPRVLRAAQMAMQRGARVTIATGRNVPSTRPFAALFGVNAPVICQQGGVIYDYRSETTLLRITLPHALTCELIALEAQHPEWRVVMYQDERIFVSDGEFFRHIHSLIGFEPAVVGDLCAVLDGRDADKVLFMVEPADAPRALAHLRALVGDRATVVQSHARFVEVNPLSADKGSALRWLANRLSVPRERVMAIGDQGNDATMVAWAGFGVAMGNGNDATKAVADWIAPSIEEDGAAVAIEKFVLGSEG
ncbi:MAG: hydrolase [Candidatus Roseilinea sp.]|nr:MAG: hydrolase [Candidatus Roseilinea sp.]